MTRGYYTHYPRAILWLVPGGEHVSTGSRDPVEVEPFYLSKLPVTNEQYEAYTRDFQRSPLAPGDRDPALGMSFREAEGYCAWYAEIARKPIRLPTETEWEYACRGVSTPGEPIETGGTWHRDNTEGIVPPLDDQKANGFGLFGMLGGAWEWTGRPRDGSRNGSRNPVLRGGSILLPPSDITWSLRREALADDRFPDAGFRIARSFRR